jgi:hypothetical protein
MSVTKKPKAKRAVEGETKQDRFVRLAKSRSVKFGNYFELLHNLVEGYTYQVEPNLAKELLAKFQKEFSDLETAWKAAIQKAEKKTVKADEPQPAGSTENLAVEILATT